MEDLKESQSMERLLKDEHSTEDLHKCPTCEREFFRPPHRRARYWIISLATHFVLLLLAVLLINSLNIPKISRTKPEPIQSNPTEHQSHFVGSPESPVNHEAPYYVQTMSPEDWNPNTYFGEPNFDSDWAWNNLTRPRSFRMDHTEAERLNFTDSIRVAPAGEDFSSMLGVMHNLHCLRRIRQMLYPDYYYPGAPEDFMAHNRGHALHCLEAIRSSVTCYPDLNPHPYFWSGSKYHDITVSAKVTRKCVNWKALQEQLAPRNFRIEDMMEHTGPAN